MQIQKLSQRQNHQQDKAAQDELPEWYHRRRGVVNCEKCGRERPSQPPDSAQPPNSQPAAKRLEVERA
jgi:hypothetical protein